jgi:hypothetical protein
MACTTDRHIWTTVSGSTYPGDMPPYLRCECGQNVGRDALSTLEAALRGAHERIAALEAALRKALDRSGDVAHSEPCYDLSCWVEQAHAALANEGTGRGNRF